MKPVTIDYRTVREWAGFTGDALAQCIDVSPATVSRIEQGLSGSTRRTTDPFKYESAKERYDRWVFDLVNELGYVPAPSVHIDYEAINIRKKLDITATEVARTLKISLSAISRYDHRLRTSGPAIDKYVRWLERKGYRRKRA